MNYNKVSKNLEKLKAQFKQLEEQFMADGYKDAEEQKILKELTAEIEALEPQVAAKVAGGVNPKDTNAGRFNEFAKDFGGDVEPEQVEKIVAKEQGIEVAQAASTFPSKNGGYTQHQPIPKLRDRPVDPNPIAVRAANLVYDALVVLSKQLGCVLALTKTGSLTVGNTSVLTVEEGIYISPKGEGEIGLVSARGTGLSLTGLQDLAKEMKSFRKGKTGYNNLIELLLINTMEGVGGSIGFLITVIIGDDKSKLAGTAYTVGLSKQFGFPQVEGNAIFASEDAYIKGLRPVGFNLGGSFAFPPNLQPSFNLGRAVGLIKAYGE
jgi:hypothetical protein